MSGSAISPGSSGPPDSSGPSGPSIGVDAIGPRGPHGREPEQRVSPRTWIRDLALGVRFAAGGGREGWTRTILTGVGVGLGVAMLLLAAAVPAMMHDREERWAARNPQTTGYIAKPTDSTLLLADASTTYHDKAITGILVRPEGTKPQRPPGVAELPPAGHMVVSPALRKLLAAAPLLRERLPYRIDGTIGHAGLMGPADLYYYAGSDRLTARDADYRTGDADRVAGFGRPADSDPMGPVFDLLLLIVLVVLLLPVAVFVGTAVRFGGERRDRRLAALRLVGADIQMTRRIAAGEALFGAVLGLLLGAVFFLIGRGLSSRITIRDISAYPSDLTPNAGLALLIVLAVPLAAVVVTMLSLRGTTIEPLGVVRQSLGRPRRLWWRLVIPAIGLLLLVPLFGAVKGDAHINEYQIAFGTILLLIGVTAVLPWLVESVVGRLRGGPVAWQLAVRRLQLNSNASARMVSGVTVAVAGAIALQMLFTGVDGTFVSSTGADPTRAQAHVLAPITNGAQTRRYMSTIAATTGVQQVFGYVDGSATQPDAKSAPATDLAYIPLAVADCPTLEQMATITSCTAGSAFLVPSTDGGDDGSLAKYAKPGAKLDLNVPDGEKYTGTPELWTVPTDLRPATSRTDPAGDHNWGLFVTPQTLDAGRLRMPSSQILVSLDPKQPEAMEYLRNAGAKLGPGVAVLSIRSTSEKTAFTQLRRGLFAGAALTMALIGASLLVTMLEQLRDRKKLLAVLVAFGTKRIALAWSVLWQTAIPVVLGLLLACAGGIGLGAALLAMVGEPFHTDWGSVAAMSAIGAGVVFAVTLLSMPPLWRLMRADGLRTE
ncbi:FtsX-like permease family protein [Streptomyces sp. NBC_01190]|uniref:FtsX-like permease family protein n=1 Tax=Streptomyces sp. NBC_01190 TaxID=2903767 RepID=UPI00386D7F6F|nr:ABC transporter permease [Streptomyces sp. NBC_01190]